MAILRPFQILLVRDAVVRRHQHVKASLLGGAEKVAVFEPVPPFLVGHANGMTGQKIREGAGAP